MSAGYDIVLNGQEIAGGSVRIHDQAVQSKISKLLGMTPEAGEVLVPTRSVVVQCAAASRGDRVWFGHRLVMRSARTTFAT